MVLVEAAKQHWRALMLRISLITKAASSARKKAKQGKLIKPVEFVTIDTMSKIDQIIN